MSKGLSSNRKYHWMAIESKCEGEWNQEKKIIQSKKHYPFFSWKYCKALITMIASYPISWSHFFEMMEFLFFCSDLKNQIYLFSFKHSFKIRIKGKKIYPVKHDGKNSCFDGCASYYVYKGTIACSIKSYVSSYIEIITTYCIILARLS